MQTKLKELEASMALQGYITSAAYAEKYNLTRNQVDTRMHTGKLQYTKKDKRYFIKEDVAPTILEKDEIWLTVQEFAEHCGMCPAWAYRQIQLGQVKTKNVGERLLVHSNLQIVRNEREHRSGQRFVYWTAKEKQECLKFS